MALALVVIGITHSRVQAQNAQCYDFGGQITQFGTAYISNVEVIGALDQIRNRVSDEAAQAIRTYWDNAQYTLCTDGSMRVTIYYDGMVNQSFDGQWANDGTFAVGSSYTGSQSNARIQMQGQVIAQNNQIAGANVALEVVGNIGAVVDHTGYGSSTYKYAEYWVQFSPWQGPPQPEAGTLTADMAAQLLASIRPNYRDISVLGKMQCSTGVWLVSMSYSYPDLYTGVGFMLYQTNYVFRDQGNGQWYIAEGTC